MAGARAQIDAPMRDGRPGHGSLITSDTPCPRCGYNLRGLNIGAPCPECGRESTGRRVRVDESTLGDAPKAYVATLGLALLISAAAGVINFFNAVPLTFGMRDGAPSLMFGAVHVIGAVVWLGATVITLRGRPKVSKRNVETGEQGVEWQALRRAALITQLVWPAVALLRCAQFGMGSSLAGWIAHGLSIVGGAGWIAVALHTSFLADWARDDGVAGRLRAAAWGFGVMGLGLLGVIHVGTLEYGWTNLVFLFSGVIVLGWVASYVMLIQGTLQLGLAAHWAIVNEQQRVERDERKAERSRRQAEERLAAEKDLPPAFEQDESLLASIEASQAATAPESFDAESNLPKGPRPGSSTPTIDRPEGLEPYRMEEDA